MEPLSGFAVGRIENVGEQVKQGGVFESVKTASSDRDDSHNQIQSNLINNYQISSKADAHQTNHQNAGQKITKSSNYRLNSTFC
nr:MAG TPA: hypothetical protein [Caudoviricetes sp.]